VLDRQNRRPPRADGQDRGRFLEQLRLRQLSIEPDRGTYERMRAAAEEEADLAGGAGDRPDADRKLTNSAGGRCGIAENQGEAGPWPAPRKKAEQMVVDRPRAEEPAEGCWPGRGRGFHKRLQVGLSEAAGLAAKRSARSATRGSTALTLGGRASEQEASSRWWPEADVRGRRETGKRRRPRIDGQRFCLGMLINLLVAEKSGFRGGRRARMAWRR